MFPQRRRPCSKGKFKGDGADAFFWTAGACTQGGCICKRDVSSSDKVSECTTNGAQFQEDPGYCVCGSDSTGCGTNPGCSTGKYDDGSVGHFWVRRTACALHPARSRAYRRIDRQARPRMLILEDTAGVPVTLLRVLLAYAYAYMFALYYIYIYTCPFYTRMNVCDVIHIDAPGPRNLRCFRQLQVHRADQQV